MEKILKWLPRDVDPVRAIEWIIASFALIGGVYLFTPLYKVSVAQNGTVGLAAMLSNPVMVLVWGGLLALGALLVMIGIVRRLPRFRSVGWFTIFMSRFFQILTTWLTVGLLPVSWLPPLALAMVAVVLWATARADVKRG
jgi:hypothetical protein